jgi:hypothetical protein
VAKQKVTKAELEKKFAILQETFNDLLFRFKYLVFDLEATRRELKTERGGNGKGKGKGKGKGAGEEKE